jgi:uncharacterized cupredoxin-like copper-binding protein
VLHVVAGLSTGHKIGLAVVGAVFIVFALSMSFLMPRRWPDFPGKNGIGPFVIACVVLFAGMLSAVYFFGKESEAKAGESPTANASPEGATAIKVTESEWKVQLPTLSTLKEGNYTFQVHNAGKVPHDLAIQGPKLAANDATPTIAPGGDATLKVSLVAGNYTVYCSIPGHKQLGMVAQISVG